MCKLISTPVLLGGAGRADPETRTACCFPMSVTTVICTVLICSGGSADSETKTLYSFPMCSVIYTIIGYSVNRGAGGGGGGGSTPD